MLIQKTLIEKRCGLNPEEKFYIRVNKHKRDVATLFLIDVSASTKKRLGKRRILDVEKDALIIMIEALESIGDKYAIYAFSNLNIITKGKKRNTVAGLLWIN